MHDDTMAMFEQLAVELGADLLDLAAGLREYLVGDFATGQDGSDANRSGRPLDLEVEPFL